MVESNLECNLCWSIFVSLVFVWVCIGSHTHCITLEGGWLVGCCLMTPGLSKDIRCHVYNHTAITCKSADQTSGHTNWEREKREERGGGGGVYNITCAL